MIPKKFSLQIPLNQVAFYGEDRHVCRRAIMTGDVQNAFAADHTERDYARYHGRKPVLLDWRETSVASGRASKPVRLGRPVRLDPREAMAQELGLTAEAEAYMFGYL